MVKRILIDKCNTIFKDSLDNYGLYPISMLSYGNNVSRVLLHFDIASIIDMINGKTFIDKDKLTYTLNMKNCASLGEERFVPSKNEAQAVHRAVSFDLITFAIPELWDEGIGFDSSDDKWFVGESSVSQDGSNWIYARTGVKWEKVGVYDIIPEIISTQHFDHGNENLEIDITSYVNSILNKAAEMAEQETLGSIENKIDRNERIYHYAEKFNYGIGIAFVPELEERVCEYTQYVGFFNNNTNTVFHPWVEIKNDDNGIMDDRYCFYQNKTNRLYFYSKVNGVFCNLDVLPKCKIDDVEYTVKQQTKGVYYTEIALSDTDVEPETIKYDVWSNIIYKGKNMGTYEQEFVVLKSSDYFSFGNIKDETTKLYPVVSGMDDFEKLIQGEKRNIKVIFKVPYTHNDYELVTDAKYRLYITDEKFEYDIIAEENIDKIDRFNYFSIETEALVPNTYFIDITFTHNGNVINNKKVLKFIVVSNKSKETN